MGSITDTTGPARPASHPTRSTIAIVAALVALGALAACGGDDEESAALPTEATAEQSAVASAGDADQVAIGDRAAGDEAGSAGADLALGSIGRDVIVELHVMISSEDLRRSVASISAAAVRLGGGIASSSVDYASDASGHPAGHAVLVVKVPPAEVSRLLDDLGTTGTVRSINQSAQDVSEQLVDLDVRIANARQSVTNVRAFMDQTENLTELVALEAELTRRQTELEQLEAQQRNLSERVALATVTIEIVPEAVVAEQDRSIGEAVGDGWEAFTAFVFGIAYLLAVLAPFLVVAGVAAIAVWQVRRMLARRAGQPAGLSPAPDQGADRQADEPTSPTV